MIACNEVSLRSLLLFFLVMIYWGVCFAPYRWVSPLSLHDNGIPETVQGYLAFPSPGIAYTKSPPEWMQIAIADATFDLQLEVISYQTRQAGPARIFTVSRDPSYRNLTIGQSREDLVVRLRTPLTGHNGVPAYEVAEVFQKPGLHRMTIRVSPENIQIEVDGHLKINEWLPHDALADWSPDYHLAFGNELTFDRPWQGEVRAATVRVRDATFSYPAASLQQPSRYIVLSERIRNLRYELLPFTSPDTLDTRLVDMVVNFLGFLPVGFLLALGRSSPISLANAFMAGAALSLSIEFGQICFEGRYPSSTDLLFNTLGSVTAAWMGNRTQRMRLTKRRLRS